MNQRRHYLLLFVSVLLFNTLLAVEIPECWEYAKKQYLNGEYQKSALSYEKLCFLQTTDSLKAKALLGKLACLERMNENEQIERCLNRLDNLKVEDELKHEIMLRKASYYISIKNLELAELTLVRIDEKELNKESHSRYWLAQYKIALQKEDQALALSVYMTHIQSDNPNEFLIKKLSKKHLFKSEKTTKTLSTIIPGTGQLYACRPDHMIYSLALIGASAAYTIGSFMTGYYVTGTLTGIPLTLKFYFGGRQNAGELIEKRNERKKELLSIKKVNTDFE